MAELIDSVEKFYEGKAEEDYRFFSVAKWISILGIRMQRAETVSLL